MQVQTCVGDFPTISAFVLVSCVVEAYSYIRVIIASVLAQ